MRNAEKKCSVKNCDLVVEAKDLCHKHYYRSRANGDPLVVKIVQKGDWPVGKKWCPKCQTFQLLESFQTVVGRKDGYCKVCRKKSNNEFRINSPEKYILKQARASAKKRGLVFELELSDIIIPDVCPVFKTRLIFSDDINNVPSLDRLDNSKGYIKGNVRVISWRANNLKSDAQVWEMELVLKYLKGEI